MIIISFYNSNEYYHRRFGDTYKEQKLHVYFDAMYQLAGMDMVRVNDADHQRKGIDVMSRDGTKLYDEKAAIKYWNRPLNTFCLELSSSNNKDGDGWLVNPNSITTHYNLVWVRSEDKDLNQLQRLDMAIVPKQNILNYLHNSGIQSVDQIKQYFKDGKAIRSKYGNERYAFNPEITFFWSHNILPENPLNILISRERLYRLSEKLLIWTPDKEASK